MFQKLQENGLIHTATDWFEYGQEIMEKLPNAQIIPHPEWRPYTKYEKKGLNAKRIITEITSIKK
jgi:tRNA G46 methylase TrmB